MKKIIIIGAGPAGLTTAYELLKDNKGEYQVEILEETQAIGGISQTVKYHGNRMDIGGHRFFSKDESVMQWWRNMMPVQGVNSFDDEKLGRVKPLEKGGPDPNKEDRVMLIRRRISRIYFNKHFFDYPISMKWETIKGMGFGTTMVAGFSYLKACIIKKPETSLGNFYINRFGKKLYSMFFEGYTEKLWGRHPSEISADWGAQRVKGLSIRAVLKDMFRKAFGGKKNNKEVETSLIEEFWYPKYGPGQLWETVAAEIEKLGGTIKKGYSVKNIVINNEFDRSKAIEDIKKKYNIKNNGINEDFSLGNDNQEEKEKDKNKLYFEHENALDEKMEERFDNDNEVAQIIQNRHSRNWDPSILGWYNEAKQYMKKIDRIFRDIENN